ncbi:MurR/RpiR family transcriptional regulator [Gluconobacter kanchanaburiensis]|uniref:Sugar isomerase n=1 Tax=Gluconobacter kanchanaburiensis NBRC 103587 TaxID=1307948 RepID=A0A511BA18_9PROT|nr:MurR/RpiR family transcriptional regulator [Gluconobacter kanchanaburiensis]MBF0862396.1 MurR/RpiR family transcriptional regulator [Gluconobacter kanchanaburiensis]GBR68724.1 RpiR family transcriptional regulator [Gluconobacter kanchanaburiensis NBRC 103587]GEK96483.1 sugar isomerase [Gluconobacter kanchanaburiensis NBRC 103587]
MTKDAISIRDQLIARSGRLTRSELKVVRVLVDNYPLALTGSMSSLARQAHVSDPTVMRAVSKLGFENYQELKAAMLEELDEGRFSPLHMLRKKDAGSFRSDALHNLFLEGIIANLQAMHDGYLPPNFHAAIDLLGRRRRYVYCLGGRSSKHLAGLLQGHLIQARPGVFHIGGGSADLVDLLADFSENDTLAVFDYRRYQDDIIAFARAAHERGVRLLLFTDMWQSPIAAFADVTLSAPIETVSPFDTLIPGLAQIEALFAAIMADPENRVRERLEDIETARGKF